MPATPQVPDQVKVIYLGGTSDQPSVIYVGGGAFQFDGTNRRMIINDETNDRILSGRQVGGF